ncbi:hypothetical protein [Mucilaginibacter auburnensis]|uniref:Uncharacterized protein n=1 Tax=Mucilaginibacter auburnensis TaxID=1457233 RepID=A0A2H9VW08_9SPHI|nr:hypothetical protein [Mucilaginibacter auburnensis]PJJ85008.1 hypothetical protein CLV57_2031 [Mucilaginibacter auburnensis]
MINPTPTAGKADKNQPILDKQIDLFLFDLKNESIELGFKQGEHWALTLSTDLEIADLKKNNHRVIVLRLQPEELLNVYQRVKRKLNQELSSTDAVLTAGNLEHNGKGFLAAYPVRNIR